MAGSKRQRELARAKYERQQARRAHTGSRRRRNQRIVAVLVVVALVAGSVAWIVLSNRSAGDVVAESDAGAALNASEIAAVLQSAQAAAEAASPDPTATPSSAASPESTADSTEEPIAEEAVLDCHAPGTPRPNDKSYASPPAAGTATSITLTTNCGDIVITLNPAAPATVASEVFLASDGFYNNTSCHRLTTAGIFVLQCGDPAGDGTGGPGYTVPDENLPAQGAANYPAGTVAMANAGPGTSGSQFFIVYDDTQLPSGYTIWGTVTEGLDIVKEIASVGTQDGGADGPPRQPVFIESATVQS